jgi:hypothetical protein
VTGETDRIHGEETRFGRTARRTNRKPSGDKRVAGEECELIVVRIRAESVTARYGQAHVARAEDVAVGLLHPHDSRMTSSVSKRW